MNTQRGYTLIEVIVAFALLALALTLLLGTLSGAARQVRNADEISRATLHAQSLLAVQGVQAPLLPHREQGEFEQGHYHWTLDVARYDDPHQRQGDRQSVGAPELLQLTLAVRWGEDARQRLQWRTLRLVPAAVAGTPP